MVRAFGKILHDVKLGFEGEEEKQEVTRRWASCTGAIAARKGLGSGETGRCGIAKVLEKAFEPVWNWASRRYQAAVAKDLKKYGESSSKPCFLHWFCEFDLCLLGKTEELLCVELIIDMFLKF